LKKLSTFLYKSELKWKKLSIFLYKSELKWKKFTGFRGNEGWGIMNRNTLFSDEIDKDNMGWDISTYGREDRCIDVLGGET
jgi:hypothetical protein